MLLKFPRRIRLRVISAKKRSTRFSYDAPVGVKWSGTAGARSIQVFTVGCVCVL